MVKVKGVNQHMGFVPSGRSSGRGLGVSPPPPMLTLAELLF